MNDFRTFEQDVMLVLYRAWQDGNSLVSFGKVLAEAGIEWQPGWLTRSHDSLRRKGYLEGPANRRIEEMTLGGLTAEGLQYVEDHLFPYDDLTPTYSGASEVPASDRVVALNHNSAEYRQIASELGEVREAIRQSNDVDPAERDRIFKSLIAAQSLWEATQLKIIQLRVGVLMAAEDAAKILRRTAKGVAAALLVDAIKALIKTHTGIDLDRG